MSTIDLNYLGQFDSIDAVWAAHPEGGHEGDYLDIVDTRYRWNKYELIWENANTVTQSPARKVDNIDGDLHVQNNLHVGGKLYASVKQPNCGLFSSLSALQAAYPHPEVGMWATIGDGIPGDIYRCDTAGEWTATGETGGADVLDITELREAIADLDNDIAEEANNRANGDRQLRTEMEAEGRVTTSRLADGAVITSKIEDGAVTSRKIADKSITNTKLATGAVDENVLHDDSVGTSHLKDGAVNASKLSANSVTNAKITNGAVTYNKLGSDIVAQFEKLGKKVTIIWLWTNESPERCPVSFVGEYMYNYQTKKLYISVDVEDADPEWREAVLWDDVIYIRRSENIPYIWKNGNMAQIAPKNVPASIFNATIEVPISGYYSLTDTDNPSASAAHAAWYADKAVGGLIISFEIASGLWKTYQYIGKTVTLQNWTQEANWKDFGSLAAGSEPYIIIDALVGAPTVDMYYTLQTAVQALLAFQDSSRVQYAKKGLIISYGIAENTMETKQFQGESLSEFGNLEHWHDFGGGGGGGGGTVETSDIPTQGGKDAFSTGGAFNLLPTNLADVTTEEDEGVRKIQMVNENGEGIGDPLAIPVGGGGEGGAGYRVSLLLREIPESTQATSDVTLEVKGTSQAIYGDGTVEDIGEELSVKIETRTSSSSPWVQVGEQTIVAGDSNWSAIHLSPYLLTGTNYVRIRAVGEYANSSWKSMVLQVVNLALIPNSAFQVPFTGSTLSLNYLIAGSIAKTLQFEFGTGIGQDFVAQFSYANNDPDCSRSLGTGTNMSTGVTFTFNNATMMQTLMADGVHTVRARLYVSESVKTEWTESQYLVGNADAGLPKIALQNVATRVTNWSNVKFFDFAVDTEGASSSTIVFRLSDANDATTYARWIYNAHKNVMYEHSVQLGIESASAADELYLYLHAEDSNGNALISPLFITIDNSQDFKPTTGAEFIWSISERDNSEEHPDTVINSANGQEITSVWTGFDQKQDGYMRVKKDVNSVSDDAETIQAVHIPAKHSIDISYNPFYRLTDGNNAGKSMTWEIDFRTSRILDEQEPVIKVGSDMPDGKVWGFEMKPMEAYVLTQRMRAVDDQKAGWNEDGRHHLAINIVYGIRGLNLCRIFLDGDIEKEFIYQSNDRYTDSGVHMVLGSNTCDLDIFGMRCYQQALSTNEVMQDYKSSLSDVDEKLAFTLRNDILDDGDNISWAKCFGKYNVIGHTGHLPKYGDENKGKTTGEVSLLIDIPGEDERSGTITALESSGQGTTAMTYYDWNQQYKGTDASQWLGKGQSEPQPFKGYAVQAGEALAKKLVGKINFASSMQGHKLGLTRAFNDLYKHLVEQNVISKPGQMEEYPNARVAVLERPFLFFHRETANDPWTFKYLMTFGAGKGDKPTFGFDKNTTPDMLMLEGANNDRPLALFRLPWNDDVTYDPDEEAYMYNGQKQLNFGIGTTVKIGGKEYPSSTAAIEAHQNFFNFAYLHYGRLSFYEGTLSQLRQDSNVSTRNFYWVTQDDNVTGTYRYDLMRYDELTSNWVNAGVAKLGAGSYERLNLRTQYEAFCTSAGLTPTTWSAGQWATINGIIYQGRRADFKRNLSQHCEVQDALYKNCFTKLFGGTDNRAKNTYYATDPVTLKIRWWEDDVDTVIKTNNVGQQRKPYYVEEHDKNAAGDYYWQGEESGFYNMLEDAFEEESLTMMKSIFTAMSSISGSVMQFMQDYILSTQYYFPEIAYNEQARLVYENAAVAQANGTYKNDSVQAITQSNGSQKWDEYQWLQDRVMYISSWCEYGEFAGSSTAANGMSWRGKSGATYSFHLTPAKWMYPRVGNDSGNYPAGANGVSRVRVAAGDTIVYPDITLSSDSWISIRGIDNYLDIGDANFGLSSEQGTFSFSGKRLQRIAINESGKDENQFLATRVEISNAVNIKEFIMRGVSSVSGAVDLTKCTRLEKIDLRDSPFTMTELPDSGSITELRLPSTLTEVRLENPGDLTAFSIDGVANVSRLIIVGNSSGYGYDIVRRCQSAQAPLHDITISGDQWQDPALATMHYLLSIETRNISMRIDFIYTSMTFALKMELLTAFGDIDDEDNDVYVTYNRIEMESIDITGNTFMNVVGREYQLNLDPQPINGNNFKSVVWSIDSPLYARISQTGVVTVLATGSEDEGARGIVTCTITLDDDTTLVATKEVKFFNRELQVGDYVFSDGSYSSESTSGGLTAIGRCFYINPNNPNDRRMYALYMQAADTWGLTSNITLVDHPGMSTVDVDGVPNNNADAIDSFRDGKPVGRKYTEAIIACRNAILKDSGVNLPVPEEQFAADPSKSIMGHLLDDLTAASSNNLRNYYYPAASRAHAYQPTVGQGESLLSKFKAGNWYVPITAEYIKMREVDASSVGTTCWACQEYNYTNSACNVQASGSILVSSKSVSYAVRAACAF